MRLVKTVYRKISIIFFFFGSNKRTARAPLSNTNPFNAYNLFLTADMTIYHMIIIDNNTIPTINWHNIYFNIRFFRAIVYIIMTLGQLKHCQYCSLIFKRVVKTTDKSVSRYIGNYYRSQQNVSLKVDPEIFMSWRTVDNSINTLHR